MQNRKPKKNQRHVFLLRPILFLDDTSSCGASSILPGRPPRQLTVRGEAILAAIPPSPPLLFSPKPLRHRPCARFLRPPHTPCWLGRVQIHCGLASRRFMVHLGSLPSRLELLRSVCAWGIAPPETALPFIRPRPMWFPIHLLASGYKTPDQMGRRERCRGVMPIRTAALPPEPEPGAGLSRGAVQSRTNNVMCSSVLCCPAPCVPNDPARVYIRAGGAHG